MQSNPQRVEAIFSAVLELTPEARAPYLDEVCGDDQDLKSRVVALLAADGCADAFLDAPLIDPQATLEARQLREGPGTVIGRYKLLERIGEGGFGAVYMAEQLEPVRRMVALKIIKLGMDTRQVIARFEAERQALALMDHPNIARVLDAGATDSGRPFFVMELVKGIPITKYCDRNKLSTRPRLELFMQVCQAVQHAHLKGIIHRDIKPNNVLVTLHDSVAVPKVIDFGIAKATSCRLTEKTLFTGFREFIGTPEYMSPDQADLSGLGVDTRTDIYSLGVMLYELLTGTTPFDPHTLRQASYEEIQRIIRDEDPPKPSTRISTLNGNGPDLAALRQSEPSMLSRLVRGDLDWIVMKAMDKDRTRRYQTAGDFTADITRYLNSEPVHAGPPSVLYKFKKFVRRHRATTTVVVVIAVALVTGLVRETMFRHQAVAERDAARDAEARAVAAMTRADAEAARSTAIADFLQELLASTDPDEAVELDVDVDSIVTRARTVFGDDHATVAATLGSLGVQLHSAGNLDGAEPLLRESLRIWRDIHGERHLNVAQALSRLGRLLRIRGDDEEAERVLRRALQIGASMPGEKSLAVSVMLLELAELLQNRGEYGEAEDLVRESIRIRRSVAPHQRFQIAMTLNLLVQSLLVAGNYEDAEALVPEVVEEWRAALPERGKSIAKLLVQFAGLHLQQGNLDASEAMYREALDIYRTTDEKPMMFIKGAVRGLVHIHNSRDDDSQAFVPVRMELVGLTRDLCGDDEPFTGEMLVDHAAYMKARDRLIEAIAMLTDGIEILRATDPQNAELANGLWMIQDIAWTVGCDPDRAAEDYLVARRAAELFLQEKPTDPPVTNTLGILHYRLGDYRLALDVLERSHTHYTQTREGGMPHDLAFMAMAHWRLGQRAEARRDLEQLRAAMTDPTVAKEEHNQAFLREAETLLAELDSPQDTSNDPD